MNPITSNSYRSLPEKMFKADSPLSASAPKLLILNSDLLQHYGLDDSWFHSGEGLGVLSGNAINPDNPPIAMAYAGHQFGHLAPLLGDGRAHMLGQINTTAGAVDVQLKGSGRTSFSRGGDGRATLASVLREHIVSEAMAGLGIAATRSLAVIETGDSVYRQQPEAGAILVRTAQSHIRVGSFQYAASSLGSDAVKALADHMIGEHFPEVANEEHREVQLLRAVAERQANLIAQWMLVGFIHGVMNTDNTSIVGETIDFGPCAFMDEFNANKVFSSIDQRGRYAWSNQPGIGLWNLTRFAETLLPLISPDGDTAIELAETQLATFMPAFQATFYAGMRTKLALPEKSQNETQDLSDFTDRTLALLGEYAIDFTVFFDSLTCLANGGQNQTLLDMFSDKATAEQWLDEWHSLGTDDADALQNMRLANPAVIARNHRVQEALHAATVKADLAPSLRLIEALKNPYHCAPQNNDLQTPPLLNERVTQTFCGT